MRQIIFTIFVLLSTNILYSQNSDFLKYLNRYRNNNGSPSLMISEKLCGLAKTHNSILIEKDTCYHSIYGSGEIITRGTGLPMDSVSINYLNRFIEKNFGKKFICPLGEQDVFEMIYFQVINNFNDSPAHKKNLLSRNYKFIGFDLDIRNIQIKEIHKNWRKIKCLCSVEYSCVIIFE